MIKSNNRLRRSPTLKPLRVIHIYMDNDKFLKCKVDHKLVKHKLMKNSVKTKYNDRDEIIHSFRNMLYDVVWLNGSTMLIRLEAINEDNFDYLTSTIERLDKDWEITKIIGESFLKVLFNNN